MVYAKRDTHLQYKEDLSGEEAASFKNLTSALTSCGVSKEDHKAMKESIKKWSQEHPDIRGMQTLAEREATDALISALSREFDGKLEGAPQLVEACLAKIVQSEFWNIRRGENSPAAKRKASEISSVSTVADGSFTVEVSSDRLQRPIPYAASDLREPSSDGLPTLQAVSFHELMSYVKEDIQMRSGEGLFYGEQPITASRHLRGVLSQAQTNGHASVTLSIKDATATYDEPQTSPSSDKVVALPPKPKAKGSRPKKASLGSHMARTDGDKVQGPPRKRKARGKKDTSVHESSTGEGTLSQQQTSESATLSRFPIKSTPPSRSQSCEMEPTPNEALKRDQQREGPRATSV